MITRQAGMGTTGVRPGPVAARVAVLLLALGAGLSAPAAAQSPEPPTAIARGAEIAVQTIRDGCTLDLSALTVATPAGGRTTRLGYRRQGGCRAIAWASEAEAIRTLVDALMPRLAAKPRPSLLLWGRTAQPELQQRMARATLAADLARLDEGAALNRRVAETLEASAVFAELHHAFAAHGLALAVGGVEKLERARPTELGRWGIDRDALGRRLTQDMRIPVAAQVTFALSARTP